MRCSRSRRLLDRKLDGRLPPRDAARLAAHLASCEPCRVAQASLARAWERLGLLSAGRGPAEDWPVIAARIAARTERWPWLRWPLHVRRLAAAGALAGLAIAGLLLGDVAARGALGPARAPSLEAIAIAEGFGDLPFGAPTPGVLLGRAGHGETP